MNSKTSHPDSLQLDQLRAGLLDEQAALKRQLEAHLAICEHCRVRVDWRSVADQAIDSGQVQARLGAARRSALQAPARRPRRYLPVAAAASILVVVTASLLFNHEDPPLDRQSAPAQAQAEPADLYEDLDFYLWLADHAHNGNKPGPVNDQQG